MSLFHRIRIEEARMHMINEPIGPFLVHLLGEIESKTFLTMIVRKKIYVDVWKVLNAPPVFSHT